ncbi:MAG TPA: twin-arginine translocase TatA/TatE family subunit [Acidimicrobiales bacterium]|nr:twin-arginine translocase TatA/TatE family subunit [Acidimicrobiales bacterium]
MFNLDPAKLLIIAVVAVILLGPDKLPQVARQAGAAWRTFNDFRHRMETEVRSTLPDLPSSHEIARLARSPTALLDRLSSMDTQGAPGGGGPSDPTNGSAPAEASMPSFDDAAGDGPAGGSHAPSTTTEGARAVADAPSPTRPFEGAGDPNLN